MVFSDSHNLSHINEIWMNETRLYDIELHAVKMLSQSASYSLHLIGKFARPES